MAAARSASTRDQFSPMEGSKYESYVLLGLEEDIVDLKKDKVDFTTSFIGGSPIWMTKNIPGKKDLICRKCGGSLSHVLQIYAPLQDSVYHRNLNIFCCLRGICWRLSESWLCTRTQMACEGAEMIPSKAEKADDWLLGASDWDAEDDHHVDSRRREPEDPELSERMTRLSTEDFINSNVSGAMAPMMNASSCIDTEDNSPDAPITVDDILRPETNIPELLFSTDTEGASCGERFVQRHLSVMEEPLAGPNEKVPSLSASASTDFDKNDALYEKSAPAHGDKWFWKFSKRLARCPSQIIRYNQGGGDVLWTTTPDEGLGKLKCEHCGSATRFELQILPTFFNSLRLKNQDWIPPDYGNLVVFTCKKSCWEDNARCRFEKCAYQTES
ncbi:unnamed protein product [Notodromas monacha]|uniref:Programmed cell death protein 2 C-terminal domain-containing protein n=1 Tax=Notodromas monacha TaxID=399045 RepID=A0A7R9BEL6_9CRUS|nr:unnamed protein product [Notodromas monacha]CAG0913963.1 unnamed protein product [Notodromas monacha]